MKSMQTALDVIGNNISNVRTYGFKSSRTTFKDVYYQRMNGGAEATANRGGTNTSSVGYGGQLGTIDVQHGQSSFTMTGRSMDMAIAGEGFFQVQDQDGNIFYTRAGMLNFDSAGNLVDSNGNFVLGVSGDPLGQDAASDKITINVPPVQPKAASITESINNKKITITATKNTEDGNVGFTFVTDNSVPIGGGGVEAEVGTNGSVVVKLSPTEKFTDFGDLSKKINEAIKKALGKEHPAGNFTISGTDVIFPANGLTGEELVGKNFGIKRGEVKGDWPTGTYKNGTTDGIFGNISIDQLGDDFNGAGNITKITVTYTAAANPNPANYKVDLVIGGTTYTGTINENNKGAGRLVLKDNAGGANGKGTIIVNHPGFDGLEDAKKALAQPANGPFETTLNNITATASTKSNDVGLSSRTFKLEGGTEGGPQGIENVDSIMVGADGKIIAKHAVHGEISVGRIDLVSFANPSGLEQAGATYFVTGANSGKMTKAVPGSDGTGQIATGSLEQSNVDLAQEFSDMIVTQRAFQANSRIISVTDTMLEELVNIKR